MPDGTIENKIHYVFKDGCFWDLVDDNVQSLIDMYRNYKNGYLWFHPLISHNPAWYVDAMLLLDLKLKQPKLEL